MQINSCTIFTKRLCLRRWCEADILPFTQMNKDTEVMKYFPKKLNAAETKEMVERINACFNKNGFGLYAVEKTGTGEFIGFTGFAIPKFNSFFTPCIEIGWRFSKENWGQGFATEAAKACLQYGFDHLQFKKIVSFTSVTNQRSERVMKRIGINYVADFDHTNIAKNNKLCRHVLYEIMNANT